MLWSAFVDAVESHLAVETNRRGLEAFRARHMRNAVLDLQRYIRQYREGFKTTYTSADLTLNGIAQQGTLPSGAKPKAFYIYLQDEDEEPYNAACCKERLQYYPWLKRQDMICGRLDFLTRSACCGLPIGGCSVDPSNVDDQAWLAKAYVYTMGPMGREFLVYPQVTDSTRLLVIFDGFLYSDIDDADDVPFPEEASEAVAYYLLSKIAGTVDKSPAMAADYTAQYRQKRLELYRDAQQEGIDDAADDPKDQELGATAVNPP